MGERRALQALSAGRRRLCEHWGRARRRLTAVVAWRRYARLRIASSVVGASARRRRLLDAAHDWRRAATLQVVTARWRGWSQEAAAAAWRVWAEQAAQWPLGENNFRRRRSQGKRWAVRGWAKAARATRQQLRHARLRLARNRAQRATRRSWLAVRLRAALRALFPEGRAMRRALNSWRGSAAARAGAAPGRGTPTATAARRAEHVDRGGYRAVAVPRAAGASPLRGRGR